MPTRAEIRSVFADWVATHVAGHEPAIHDCEVVEFADPPAAVAATNGRPVSTPPSPRRERWSVAEVLYSLWDDREALPDGLCAMLSLPDASTYSHAARLVWVLHDAEDFPAESHADVVQLLHVTPFDLVEPHWRDIDTRLRTPNRR